MRLEKATFSDVDRILEIMDSARAYQRSLGFTQWEDGYPGRNVIESDIEGDRAYLLKNDDKVLAYSVLAIGDRAYDCLANRWRYTGRYGVVHRIGVAPEFRGKNISSALFSEYERVYRELGINIIRIDTGTENRIMQHLMDKFGYESRGVMMFEWGERIGYEKRIL